MFHAGLAQVDQRGCYGEGQAIEFSTPRETRKTGRYVMALPEFKQIVDAAKAQIQEIGPAELTRILDAGDDFSLIDIREADEQAQGMMPGAIALPRGILERDIDKVTTEKGRKMVLY